VDVTATLDAPCGPAEVYPWIVDLARYPEWLDIVPRAVAAPARDDDGGAAAWSVDLRGRLGPFARAKRLRMVRTLAEAPHRVRFERAEHDGRQHSPWVLDAELGPHDGGTRLTMRLHYGGRLWMPALDRLLTDEIERSRPRLLARITEA
jgi:hypothetical protein